MQPVHEVKVSSRSSSSVSPGSSPSGKKRKKRKVSSSGSSSDEKESSEVEALVYVRERTNDPTKTVKSNEYAFSSRCAEGVKNAARLGNVAELGADGKGYG